MPRLAGHYEWDDPSLTPGQKREGGLHQNLYDEDGLLQGHARFVPDESLDLDEDVSPTSYVPTEQRWELDEDSELAALVGFVVAGGIVYLAGKGVEQTAPYLKRWWNRSAQPFLSNQVVKAAEWWRRDKAATDGRTKDVGEAAAPDRDQEEVTGRPAMSSAEAQARLLAAMAAHAYSQEQLRLVEQARIVDAAGIKEVQQQLASLSQTQITAILEQMVRDPSLLQDVNLANLASLLSRPRLVPTGDS